MGMIEAQQEKLRDAVKHNKGIVVHPRTEVMLAGYTMVCLLFSIAHQPAPSFAARERDNKGLQALVTVPTKVVRERS